MMTTIIGGLVIFAFVRLALIAIDAEREVKEELDNEVKKFNELYKK